MSLPKLRLVLASASPARLATLRAAGADPGVARGEVPWADVAGADGAAGGSLSGATIASRKPGSAIASLLSRTRTSSLMPWAPRLTPAPKPRFLLDWTTVRPARLRRSTESSPEALSTTTSVSPPPSCAVIERAARIVSSAWRQLTMTTRADGRLTGWVTPHLR